MALRRRNAPAVVGKVSEAVRPVTHDAAALVEERWADLISPQELEALRASLLHLMTELRAA